MCSFLLSVKSWLKCEMGNLLGGKCGILLDEGQLTISHILKIVQSILFSLHDPK